MCLSEHRHPPILPPERNLKNCIYGLTATMVPPTTSATRAKNLSYMLKNESKDSRQTKEVYHVEKASSRNR